MKALKLKTNSLGMITPIKLLTVQILCWLSIIPFYYFADLKWIIASFIGYVLYAGVGVAMTFHRQLSHRTYLFNPVVEKILMYIASLANVGSPITWVAIHRAHHRHCDTAQDPHSPLFKSSAFVLLFSMYAKVRPKFAIDLMKDRYALFLHHNYFFLQIPVILFWYAIGGWQAIVAMHLIPSAFTWLAGSFLNWTNHQHGYTVKSILNSSRNQLFTGYLVMGEGWHNAHHASPRSLTTKTNWWELDPIYWFAKCLGGVKREPL